MDDVWEDEVGRLRHSEGESVGKKGVAGCRFQGVQTAGHCNQVFPLSLIAVDCPPLSDEPWALSLIDMSSRHRKRHRQTTHLTLHIGGTHMLDHRGSFLSQMCQLVSPSTSRSIFLVSRMSVARSDFSAGAVTVDLERVSGCL